MRLSKRDRQILEKYNALPTETITGGTKELSCRFNDYSNEFVLKKSGSYDGSGENISESDVRKNIACVAKDLGIKAMLGKRINSGGFCDVYAIEWDGIEAVLKVAYDKNNNGDKFVENQRREISYLRTFTRDSGDSYTAKLLQAVEFQDEYGAPLSFFVILKKYQTFKEYTEQYPITEKRLCRIAEDVLSDLDYMNNQGIMHRDIKPANIVVNYYDKQPHFILIDLNVARYLAPCDTSNTITRVGSEPYMDPVLYETGHGSYYTDIFSLGSVLYELIIDASIDDKKEVVRLLPRSQWERIKETNNSTEQVRIRIYRKSIRDNLIKYARSSGFSDELCEIILKSVDCDLKVRYKEPDKMRAAIRALFNDSTNLKDDGATNAKYYIHLDEDGDLIWVANKPPELVRMVDPQNYNQSLANIYEAFGDLRKTLREKNYIEKPESFFENLIYESNIAKLAENDFFQSRIRQNSEKGQKGALLQNDDVSLRDGTKLRVISSVIFQGEEYAYCCTMHEEKANTYVDNFHIRKLYSNGSLPTVEDKVMLCQVIPLLMDKMRDEKHPEWIKELIITCYYSGKKEDATEKNMILLMEDALMSNNSKVKSIASYYLGGSYLLGRGVERDRKKAQQLLSQSSEVYAAKWRKRAYGFTPAHCVLWIALVLIEILAGILLYQSGSWVVFVGGDYTGKYSTYLAYCFLDFGYIFYIFYLLRVSIWKFDIDAHLQIIQMCLGVIFMIVGMCAIHIKYAAFYIIFHVIAITLPLCVYWCYKRKGTFW